ncbi:hypothetical protein ACIA98_41330 [Streptomyces sp. NPDC051366]|uniref:hypothetical protein n=1 Tax=Streptomyces sp. NPDC051366 TaxID=3365652 RepID=UPI0037B3B148
MGCAPTPAAPAAAPAPVAVPAPEVVGLSEDARRYYGPLTEGLSVPKDVDLELGGRNKALHQLGIRPPEHARIAVMVKDVLGERDAGLLLNACSRPLLAARMR